MSEPTKRRAPAAAAVMAAAAALAAAAANAAAAGTAAADGGSRPAAPVVPADADTVRAAVRAPGARAVLVNVWATWCDGCREEMPALVKFHRDHRAQGVRLVLVSADEPEDRQKAERFLASQGVDFPSWLKRGDDMAFINGLEPRWTGALPASFLYDDQGKLCRIWQGEVTTRDLERALADISKPTRRKP